MLKLGKIDIKFNTNIHDLIEVLESFTGQNLKERHGGSFGSSRRIKRKYKGKNKRAETV